MRTPLIGGIAATVLAVACSSPPAPSAPAASPATAPFPIGAIVDLSHAYDANAIFWPTAEPFRLEKVADGVTPAGYYYAANNFFTSEHGGTHMDAPVHFAKGHPAADQVPLDRLLGPALVIDVRDASAKNPDYQVTVEDLQRFEQQHGAISRDAIVLLRTGFSERWPDPVRYLGTNVRGEAGAAQLHFPGLHPEAAKWIVANRPIKAIGIDTASIDYGQSKVFESHQALYGHDIPACENLTSLDQLPVTGAYMVALPMKIAGGSGAPLRAIAVVPGAH